MAENFTKFPTTPDEILGDPDMQQSQFGVKVLAWQVSRLCEEISQMRQKPAPAVVIESRDEDLFVKIQFLRKRADGDVVINEVTDIVGKEMLYPLAYEGIICGDGKNLIGFTFKPSIVDRKTK